MTRRYWLISSATVLLAACGSTVGVGRHGSDQLASTRIRTTSSAAVLHATESVFHDEGFSTISSGINSITFSKVGGRGAEIAWKDLGNDNPVLIQPTVTWRSDGENRIWVGCAVEIVQRSKAFGNSVQQPVLAGKAACSSMLGKVKRRVEKQR